MTTHKNSTMTSLFNRDTWRRVIQPRFPHAAGIACGLATCPRPRSLWQEIKKTCRHGGTFLEGSCTHRQPQCLETALTVQLSTLRGQTPTMQPPNRIPLGLLMVARGKLTYPEVQTALEAQRRAGAGKIGEWIEKLGFASEQEVTKALALQWGCPVAASFDRAGHYSAGEIPLPILEALQMLPLNYILSTNTLYLAFGERVDHAALYAIEKILNCRTLPCVAGRESIATQLEAMHQISRPARRGIWSDGRPQRDGPNRGQLCGPPESGTGANKSNQHFYLAASCSGYEYGRRDSKRRCHSRDKKSATTPLGNSRLGYQPHILSSQKFAAHHSPAATFSRSLPGECAPKYVKLARQDHFQWIIAGALTYLLCLQGALEQRHCRCQCYDRED